MPFLRPGHVLGRRNGQLAFEFSQPALLQCLMVRSLLLSDRVFRDCRTALDDFEIGEHLAHEVVDQIVLWDLVGRPTGKHPVSSFCNRCRVGDLQPPHQHHLGAHLGVRLTRPIIMSGHESALGLSGRPLMDHPNIAKVFDGGVTGYGSPYFAMELVKGVPITGYCDERKLTLRERLALFVSVWRAVQHAHLKGIIHRDLKPTNVLVARYDDRPMPKVIDFGVAKAVGQPLTENTLVTKFGAIIGTPAYMSPEQAKLNQLDIDTRSDIYALGVLLYELLTGSTPFSKQLIGESWIARGPAGNSRGRTAPP